MDLEKHLKNLTNNPNGFAENYNLGIVFHELGDLSRSKNFFKRAISINSENPLAYNDLGTVYTDIGNPILALKYFKKALKLNNKFSDAVYNIGFLYSKYKSKTKFAKKYFKKAYELDENNSKALAMYYQAIRGSCDFDLKERLARKLDKLTMQEIKNKEQTGESPFLNLTRKQDEKQNYEVAKSWSKKLQETKHLPRHKAIQPLNIKYSRIRIGYASDGLRDFPTGHNLAAVLANHSKNIHLSIYTWGKSDNSVYENVIKERTDNYTDISNLSDQEAAEKIFSDQIDILIDLKGHTRDNRMSIFSSKPAPIIVNYLGYPGTTGSNFHDYLIADEIVIPEKSQKYFSERIVYLPHCYRPADTTTVISNHKSKKPNNKFVFGSLNSAYKIDREIYNTWIAILSEVKNSELWILSDNKETNGVILAQAGIYKNRIKFLDFKNKQEHLDRLSEIDLCLDTKVVSGHTTTTDSLRMGIPTLCMKGNHFSSRVSESVLTELGLKSLIAKNLIDYRNIAIKFATSDTFRHKLSINQQSSIIFKPKAFANSLEKVYFALYQTHEK